MFFVVVKCYVFYQMLYLCQMNINYFFLNINLLNFYVFTLGSMNIMYTALYLHIYHPTKQEKLGKIGNSDHFEQIFGSIILLQYNTIIYLMSMKHTALHLTKKEKRRKIKLNFKTIIRSKDLIFFCGSSSYYIFYEYETFSPFLHINHPKISKKKRKVGKLIILKPFFWSRDLILLPELIL